MQDENENLSDKIDDINSQLVKANDFNENAALELDLIYNFFSENQNLFKHQSGSMPYLDKFFDDNGYIPVKVLNPCCCNHEDEEAIDWPKLPAIPKGRPIEVPVTEPITAPAPKPAVRPLTHPISKPIPFLPPTGVVSTPPVTLPTPSPTDAPIVMPKTDVEPDLIGSPVLPPVQAPDVTPIVPSTPLAPVTTLPTSPEPFADSYSIGDPMGTGVEGMNLDTTTPTDLSESGPIVTAINEHPYAFLTALAASPLLGMLGLPSLPAWAYGAAGLGTAAMIPITVNAAEAPPTEPPAPVLNEKQKQKLNSDYSPISYSTRDNAVTDEITLKADEIKFISDVIRFKNTGIATQQYSSSVTQDAGGSSQNTGTTPQTNNASGGDISSNHESKLNGNETAKPVQPKSETEEKTKNNADANKVETNHESKLNGNEIAKPAQKKPETGLSANMGINGISEIGSSLSSMVSSIGKTLTDLSSKTFMAAKVAPPKVKSQEPVQSQPVMYNSETTGYPTAGTDKPHPAGTVFEQMIFQNSGMFT